MKTFLLIKTEGIEFEAEIDPGHRVTGHTALEIGGVDYWHQAHNSRFMMVDKESVADTLLTMLAQKCPGQVWRKYRLCAEAKAKPGPVDIKTVTEQGVLPA